MPHLHLPAHHTDADLVLAGTLAQLLSSEDLYVTWSLGSGHAAPVVPSSLRLPAVFDGAPRAERPVPRRRPRRRFGSLFGVFGARQR